MFRVGREGCGVVLLMVDIWWLPGSIINIHDILIYVIFETDVDEFKQKVYLCFDKGL